MCRGFLVHSDKITNNYHSMPSSFGKTAKIQKHMLILVKPTLVKPMCILSTTVPQEAHRSVPFRQHSAQKSMQGVPFKNWLQENEKSLEICANYI